MLFGFADFTPVNSTLPVIIEKAADINDHSSDDE